MRVVLQGGGVLDYSDTAVYTYVSIVNSQVYSNQGTIVRAHAQKFPSLGDSCFVRRLQGGGVYVWYGTVSIVNSQIYSNTAISGDISVRADVLNFPTPRWGKG